MGVDYTNRGKRVLTNKLIIVIEIQKMQAGCYYVLQGKCSAGSNFIEKESHAKLFLYYLNEYLGKYIKLHDFLITKDGWTIEITIRSKTTILKYHQMYVDKKKSEENSLSKVSEIVAEQFRKFLSIYVRVTNKLKGRTGALVHSVYKRYYFGTLAEAKTFTKTIRKGLIKLAQKKKKYQGRKKYYEITKKQTKGSVFLVSRGMKKKKRVKKMGLKVFEYMGIGRLVALKLIENTFSTHNSP